MITISDTSAAPSGPAFVLSRPHRTVVAAGAGRVFGTAHEAVRALRSGRADYVVGALPFAPGAPAALWAPESVTMTAAAHRPAAPAALPRFELDAAVPAPETHLQRVAGAVRLLGDLAHPVRKVVLARAIRARSERPVAAGALLDLLVSTDPSGNGFLVDLSAAGGSYRGRHLVGASPEVLVRRMGTEVLSHPLAGSARRLPDAAADRAAAGTLLASSKDRDEHRYVVDQVTGVLQDRCAGVHTPATPELTRTPVMWHLGTPITATVPAHGPSALELALALHPTPAVCGTPTAAAADLIAELEGDRGFYAGAVGWCDAAGNGEWMVSIRCAELDADGRTLLAHAGGGIVAESDPAAELAETTGKFQRILGPLGIADLPLTVA
ncbi:isochorismate synthase [Nocardia mexicana]|uniref:Isochorismate synthase n=1 Tax=Nocardia mexicana TaxID=279262 RepID=A0A370H2E3_9NOCA|nr:chorismate-binding protein [Nocardia mexicana]RDI50176.1 isochorismate synthase [Nocardia mexicana]